MPAARSDGPSLCRRIVLVELAVLVVLLALFPFTGRLLYHEDQPQKSDVLFVLAGEPAERWLEAFDLQRAGYAPQIVLSAGYRDASVAMLDAEGIHVPSEGEIAKAALFKMGLSDNTVTVMPGFPDNTAEEGQMFRREALAHHWTSVIVVTSKLHTRRAGFAIRRELAGTGIRVLVRASRYDEDNPNWWWTKRRTIRSVVYEVPKLIAYGLGLGA